MEKIAPVIFFIAFLLTGINHSAWSQASLRFQGGYMFPLAGGLLNPYLNGVTTNPDKTTALYGSWGKGGAFEAELEYKFTRCIDIELGAAFRYGAFINYNDTIGGLTNVANDRLHFFEFSLGDVYNFCCGKSLVPYLGAGVTFAVDDDISIVETSSDKFGNTDIFTSNVTCAPAIGAYGKFGATWHLSSTFSFFGELRIDVLSLTPQKYYTGSVTTDGDDITYTLLPFQQEIDYSKSIALHIFSQLQPLQQIAQPVPASSWGINLGIEFNFGT